VFAVVVRFDDAKFVLVAMSKQPGLFDCCSQQLIEVRIWHRESPSDQFARFMPDARINSAVWEEQQRVRVVADAKLKKTCWWIIFFAMFAILYAMMTAKLSTAPDPALTSSIAHLRGFPLGVRRYRRRLSSSESGLIANLMTAPHFPQ
jgi:hypothetical protein